jgi:hypothetical protein
MGYRRVSQKVLSVEPIPAAHRCPRGIHGDGGSGTCTRRVPAAGIRGSGDTSQTRTRGHGRPRRHRLRPPGVGETSGRVYIHALRQPHRQILRGCSFRCTLLHLCGESERERPVSIGLRTQGPTFVLPGMPIKLAARTSNTRSAARSLGESCERAARWPPGATPARTRARRPEDHSGGPRGRCTAPDRPRRRSR